MITPILLSVLLITQADSAKNATLIVVASDRSNSGDNEFLALEASGKSIDWKFMTARGHVARGVDPEGEVEAQGKAAGDATMLRAAFERTLGVLKEGDSHEFPDNDKRNPRYFSLMLLQGSHVKTCQLWSKKQHMILVQGNELKEVFSLIRKQVFGRAYSMPDLWDIGSNPELNDPLTPSTEDHCHHCQSESLIVTEKRNDHYLYTRRRPSLTTSGMCHLAPDESPLPAATPRRFPWRLVEARHTRPQFISLNWGPD